MLLDESNNKDNNSLVDVNTCFFGKHTYIVHCFRQHKMYTTSNIHQSNDSNIFNHSKPFLWLRTGMPLHYVPQEMYMLTHYRDVILSAMAFQITGVKIICSKTNSKLRVTGLYEGNLRVTGGFRSQMVKNAENVSIWWRHHAFCSV